MSESPLGDAVADVPTVRESIQVREESEVVGSEDSPGFTEDLPDDFDGDEDVEADDSESPYVSAETHGSEEGEDDE